MKFKRIMALILTFCIVLSSLGTVVFAEDTETSVFEVKTQEELISALATGGTVKLGGDILTTTTEADDTDPYTYIMTGANTVLDLNGYSITPDVYPYGDDETYYILICGDLTITDTSDSGNGSISAREGGCLSAESTYIDDIGWTDAPTITVEGGTVTNLAVGDDASVIVNGGDVTLYLYELDYFYEDEEYLSYLSSLTFSGVTADNFLNLPEGYELVETENGTYGIEEVVELSTTVAKIGDTEYETLQAAINAASDTDVITVLRDITEPITSLRGKIVSGVEGGVTITGTHNDWIYVAYSFTIGENVTFTTPAIFLYCGDGVINGKVICESYYQRYAGTKLTINEPGNLTVTDEAIYLTFMDGDPKAGIYINGDNNDETAGLNAAVIYFYEGMLSAKNANVNVGTFWQTNDTYYKGTANLSLDNSKLNVYVTEHPAKATGNATVTLKNGSAINAPGGFVYSPTTKFDLDGTSSIKDKGKDLFTVKVGNTLYVSLQNAIEAAKDGDVVEILANEITFSEDIASIVIDKGITIKGKGETATKLIFNSATSAFVVASSNVTFEDMTIVQGTKDNSFHISISKGAWDAPEIAYENITIKNIEFINSDYALCLIGENVTVDNCTFTNQDSHNIIVYSLKGNSNITNNVFGASKGNNKSAILFEGGADNATDLSGFIGGGKLTIDGNEANNKGVFFQFTNWKLVKEMNVAITNNVVDAFTNKAIALYDMDGAITAAGDEFSSFVVNENAFTNVPASRPIVREYTGTVEVDASKNYLGSAEPDMETLLVSDLNDTVKAESYYATYENGELSDLVSLINPVAKIGEVTYSTIQTAIEAASEGDTITLLSDVVLDESVTVAVDDVITLDLAGKTITRTQSTTATGNDQLIKNNGKLTIKDSSENLTGKLLYNYTGESVNNVSLSTISNPCGTLIIESGTIENASDASGRSAAGTYLYAIDSLTNGGMGEASVTINGGVVKSDYMAIRQFVNGADCANKLTVTGGEIVATSRAINVQCSDSAKNTNAAFLNISGGTVKATGENGYSVCAVSYSENVAVTGGSFEGNVWFGTKAITGGTFATSSENAEIINSYYCADGYTLAVASVGVYKAGTLPDAEVKNLGAITVSQGDGEYQFKDSYYVYDLVGNQNLTSATDAFDINIAMEFIAKDSKEEAEANAFGNYTTDFFIKIDGLANCSFIGNGCYLAGYYPSFGAWVKIPLDGFKIEDGAVYPVITSAGFDFKYTDICDSVQDFICGIYLTDEVIDQNPDINVNLTLGLSENKDAALNAEFEKVDDYTYTAKDFATNVATVTDSDGNVTGYTTLEAAINAANEGDTITLLTDVVLEDTLHIVSGKNITLDLAGKTISQTKEQTAGYQMILNDGNLTIDDTVGGGKISYTDSGNGGEYISDTIYNCATLVINGGTIENLSSATVASNGYPHAVDTYSGIRDTSVTVNGGTIYCEEYSAIRMFCVSATKKADLVINDGTVKGSIDMQNGITEAAIGALTINGGEFETTKNSNNIRFANWNGNGAGYGIIASITGGNFNGSITTQYVPDAADFNSKMVTGGTFASNPGSEFAAEGFEFVENSDGTYGVQEVVEKELFDIPYASVIFGNNLDMSFAMPISSLEDWTGHYVEIVKEYSDGRENAIKTIAYDDFEINGNFYVVTFNGIAAKEMTDNLYVTVYDADGNPASNTRVDSIRAYSDRVYSGQSIELKTIIADMLNYGAAAQGYFNDYNAENLANSGFDTTYATKNVPTVENYLTASNDNFVGSSIVLASNIDYRMAFKKSMGEVTKATVEFVNHYGQLISYEIEKDDLLTEGDFYIVIIDKVVVADARRLITVKLYNEETELVSVSDSMESYASRLLGGNNPFASTMMEFMKFADAADSYFDSQN